MRPILIALGLVFILAGGTFALQGFGFLPGSFMTGQPQWAVTGTVGVVVGILILAAVLSRRRA